jgi:thiamine biosynthesis protein ThiI
MKYILIHYHELALKGKNRPLFLRQLAVNIERAIKDFGFLKLTKPSGRLVVFFNKKAPLEEIKSRLRKIPGIADFSETCVSESNLADIAKTIFKKLKDLKFKSFKIRARRADKSLPFNSKEANEKLGDLVRKKTGAMVDLRKPELTIFVEALSEQTFIYFEKIKGVGGLPVGVSGRGVVLLSGGIDSPVASFMMMRRGLRVVFVHFHAYPFFDRSSIDKVKELVRVLDQYQLDSELYLAPIGDSQKEIVLKTPPGLRLMIYRRLMFRVAERLAFKVKAKALITGDSLGQVASQTIENLLVAESSVSISVFRPLIGLNKEDIIKEAKKLGTYEISIIPDQDCCQLFVPKHPNTRADLEKIDKLESELGVEKLVDKALKSVDIFKIS